MVATMTMHAIRRMYARNMWHRVPPEILKSPFFEGFPDYVLMHGKSSFELDDTELKARLSKRLDTEGGFYKVWAGYVFIFKERKLITLMPLTMMEDKQ